MEQSLHDHLLPSAFPQTTFVGFGLSHAGLFCFGLMRIDPWYVNCDDLINVFWSIAIVFVQHFFTPIDKSFLRPAVHAISNVCWWKEMPKDASISRYLTCRSCIISSRTASMFSDTAAVFGRSSWTLSFNDRRPQLNL